MYVLVLALSALILQPAQREKREKIVKLQLLCSNKIIASAAVFVNKTDSRKESSNPCMQRRSHRVLPTLSADDLGHMFRAGNGDALGDILRLLGRAGQQRAGVTAVEVAERRLLAARSRVRRCGVVPADVDIQHRELERRLQRPVSLHAVNLICCHFVEDWRGERGGELDGATWV